MPDSASGANAFSSTPVARISLTALLHNYSEVKKIVGAGVRVLAMVKADAYGHGAREIGRALAGAGCRQFGVATLAEATELGDALAGEAEDARIAIFGGLLPAEAGRAVELGVEVATHEPSVVEALAARARADGREMAVHVKIDTGMTRLGVMPADALEFARLVEATEGVRAVGVCSHFAQAESVTGEVTRGQSERLAAVAEELAAAGIRVTRHLANSAAILTRPEAHLDMVRPGLMLYGLYPDEAMRYRARLEPVMTVVARVMRVAEVAAGQGLSYGHTFHTQRPSRIATLRCGYADGYPRALSNCGQVVAAAALAPVVGRVCMDHTMIDVTELAGVELGDTVTLWGDGLPAEEVAGRAGTIPYEMVTRLGKRVPREYRHANDDGGSFVETDG